jgi:hypothetical protein
MPGVTSSMFQVSSLALLSREHLLRNILVAIPSYPLPYPSSTKPTLEKLGLLFARFKYYLNIRHSKLEL